MALDPSWAAECRSAPGAKNARHVFCHSLRGQEPAVGDRRALPVAAEEKTLPATLASGSQQPLAQDL